MTERALTIRNHEIIFGTRTYIMGIVNVTPDSFSNDGIVDSKKALSHALQQIEQGADIIDIGGQSARPGYAPIDEETEIKRVIPVIKELRKQSNVIISVDTFSPKVLAQAVSAGADILNSIRGLTDELLDLIKHHPMPVVIMHNGTDNINGIVGAAVMPPAIDTHSSNRRGEIYPPVDKPTNIESVGADCIRPGSPSSRVDAIDPYRYPNGVVNAVVDYLSKQAQRALSAGLTPNQIILDPGIGFGKTPDENLELLSQFKEITELGFPTLIGSSRKSTIGKLIDRPVDQRVFGTAATVAYAIAQLVDIVRVHDVAEILDVVKVSDALVRNWRPNNWNN